MFWLIVILVLAVLALISVIYLVTRFHRFRCLQNLSKNHKILSWLLACVPVAGVACFYFINLFTMFVVMIHLMVIWLLCDLIAAIIRKAAHRERTRNYEGGAAILLTAAVLGAGWYFAHHVYVTRYQFTTQKDLGGAPLRIVEIADSHLGITLKGDSFAREMQKVQAENPDIVVVCGDFVDDDSTKADMLEAAKALGSLQTTYGVYFIYGNHDNGYYHYRDFDSQELYDALTANGITVLTDESVLVADRFYIVGREDKSNPARAEIGALTAKLDDAKYQIVLDHQPNDYAAEAAAGADLVLSGHTHGGHIFPAGYIGLALGANDRVYGTERRGETDFLVTSGISGWAIPFKTGTISEICVIDVTTSQ